MRGGGPTRGPVAGARRRIAAVATAGLLAVLLVGAFAAAVVGDSVAYAFGKRIGPALFTREDSLIFNRKYVVEAQHFYEKYGRKLIILARFMPVVRTFAPIVAGIGNMRYRDFIAFNVIGGFFWPALLIGLGFGFGSIIPDPDHYLLPAVAIIIIISILPALRQIFRKSRS